MGERGVREVFAASVRKHRQARGWSLDELARRSGVASSTVVNVEQRRTGTSLAVAAALAGAFGTTIGDLAGDGRD